MKIQELRNRISSLARSQMTTEQTNQSLQALVNALDQLETGQLQEVSRLRRQLRWLWAATITAALMLSLTCSWLCWENRQSQQQLAQSQVQLARQQEQLSQQQEKLTLYEGALLKLLQRMTSQPPSQTSQR